MAPLNWLRAPMLCVVSFTYNGALHHYTVDPVMEIERHQHNPEKLRAAIQRFKLLKTEEMHFVRRAAALSAAVVIGIFSWPATADAFWLCPLLWYCGLWLSIFALIGFSQSRMLDEMVATDSNAPLTARDEAHLQACLKFFLCPPRRKISRDAEKVPAHGLEFDSSMAFVWQNQMMLMSYSWVCFLLGYTAYLITPLLGTKTTQQHKSATAIVSLCVGAAAAMNFELTAVLSKRAVKRVQVATLATQDSLSLGQWTGGDGTGSEVVGSDGHGSIQYTKPG